MVFYARVLAAGPWLGAGLWRRPAADVNEYGCGGLDVYLASEQGMPFGERSFIGRSGCAALTSGTTVGLLTFLF